MARPSPRTSTCSSVLLLLGTAVLLLALAAFAPAAGAHATLVDSVPADGATTRGEVDELALSWSEPVQVTFGGIKAWGPDEQRVDEGSATVDGRTVRAPIDGSASGTYAVSYRIVSSDGHPVRGAFTFNVREESSGAATRKALEASEGSRPLEVAFGVARGIALLCTILLAGGMAFVLAISPGSRPRGFAWMVVGGIVAAISSFVLDAAISGGFSLVEVLTRTEVLASELGTAWGRAAVVLAVALVVVAAWIRWIDVEDVRTRLRGVLVAAPAFLPLVAWPIGGHALDGSDPVALRLPLDLLHTCAAAVWLGGLVQLAGILRAGRVSVEHVERWSRVALGAVLLLVVTGLYAAYVEIGLSREALVDTTYGRLVVAKSLLLLGTLPLAWFNRQHNVPGLRDRLADTDAVRHKLRTYVRGEVLILVLVVAATAALIQTPPARTQVAPPIVDSTTRLGSGGSVQLVIDPGQQGRNEIHVYVSDETGRPDGEVTDLALVAANEAQGIEGLQVRLLPSGPGHYTVPSGMIQFAGPWTFAVSVQRGRYESERATFSETIAPAAQE